MTLEASQSTVRAPFALSSATSPTSGRQSSQPSPAPLRTTSGKRHPQRRMTQDREPASKLASMSELRAVTRREDRDVHLGIADKARMFSSSVKGLITALCAGAALAAALEQFSPANSTTALATTNLFSDGGWHLQIHLGGSLLATSVTAFTAYRDVICKKRNDRSGE